LDSKASNRLIFFKSAHEFNRSISLKKTILRRHPNTTFHIKLQDAHLYLFSRWVLDLIVDVDGISSIQDELIPYLVKHQFTSYTAKYQKQKNHEEGLVVKMTHAPKPAEHSLPGCYAFITPTNSYCVRVNTAQAYKEINFQLSKLVYTYMPWTPVAQENFITAAITNNPKAQLGGSVIGEGLKIGESSVKKSIVGKNVTIGNRCKISDSILMDNVSIQDGAVITNSVLCHNVVCGEKSTVTSCTIGYGYSIPPSEAYKNEIVTTSSD